MQGDGGEQVLRCMVHGTLNEVTELPSAKLFSILNANGKRTQKLSTGNMHRGACSGAACGGLALQRGWSSIAACSLQSRLVFAGTRCYSLAGGWDLVACTVSA